MRCAAWLGPSVLLACREPDEERPTQPDVPPPATAAWPKPTRLALDCAATTNALRFACTVEVDPPQPVLVTWTPLDGLGPTRARMSEAALAAHELALYYFAPDRAYEVRAVAASWPDEPPATAALHSGIPPVDVLSWVESTGVSSMGLFGSNTPCSGDAVATIFDAATGELVWYHELDPAGQFRFVDMVSFADGGTVLGETGDRVVGVDLAGETRIDLWEGVDYSYDLHHDLVLRNDQLYVLHQYRPMPGLTLDGLLVLDPSTGAELAHFLPDEHLPIPKGASGDFLHTNAVFVDDAGDIHLSWLSQATVLKIRGDVTSPGFGDPLWVLESDEGSTFDGDIVTDWSGVGGVDGFGHQHNLGVRADGRIQLLDNTHGRALVISVDEPSGTATVDGAYSTGEGSCGPQGTAMETATGNLLVGCSGRQLKEYDVDSGAVVWEAELLCANGNDSPGSGGVRFYPLDGWEPR